MDLIVNSVVELSKVCEIAENEFLFHYTIYTQTSWAKCNVVCLWRLSQSFPVYNLCIEIYFTLYWCPSPLNIPTLHVITKFKLHFGESVFDLKMLYKQTYKHKNMLTYQHKVQFNSTNVSAQSALWILFLAFCLLACSYST